MHRHETRISQYEQLSTEKALRAPIEIIRKSRDAVVYTFKNNGKSFRSSSELEFYDASQEETYYLAENPRINSLNPVADIKQLKSERPSVWRLPLAVLSAFFALSFLLSFLSPVFREKLEYWMYRRREVSGENKAE